MIRQVKSSRGTPVTLGRLIAVFLFLVLTCASMSMAQLPTATILGVVRDVTGAVVPETTLTARNLENGQTRSAVAEANGSFRFAALPVGPYEIRAEHPGFQASVHSGLNLSVGQEAVVNFALQVGAVEQTVEVTAEAPLVNTTSGSLGGLVNEQRVADLPLNGRNYVDLTLLQTGVSEDKTYSHVRGVSGTWFSSSGAPVRSNNYLLDGASMVNMYGATSSSYTGTTLGVDGIREYKVITNSFSAEYGMTMGSQMLIASKGGTNNFHGTAFEFLRNSALDARNFFDRKSAASQRRLPEFVRNNYGGSFGGPIKKDKTFFFGVYEGLRERKGITTIINVIPLSAKVDGGLVPQIAPQVKPLLTLFPDPNLPNNQFTFPFSQPTNESYGQARVDQNYSTNDTLFARYTVDDAGQLQNQGYPQYFQNGVTRAQFATLSESHVFSPVLLNTFRFSYSRQKFDLTAPTIGNVVGPQFSEVPGQPSSFIIGGVTSLTAGGGPILRKQNIFAWSDDMFYTRGRHSLKFGTLINRYQQLIANDAGAKGSATFPTLTSFLLAKPSLYSAWSPAQRTFQYTTLGFYGEDDLRVRSNFTLNLGLRYEFLTTPKEKFGNYSALRDVQHDQFVTVGPELFKNPSYRNFSPRFGFAWDVMGNGKTAVRGGFGLLYDIGNYGSLILQTIVADPPFANASQVANPPTFTLPLTFPPGSAGNLLRPTDYHLQQSHILQYNLTVERQLPFDMGLTLAYGGSRGINLTNNQEGNPTIPQILPDGRLFWTGKDPRTNPFWPSITDFYTAGASSWYNSFQFGLNKRLGRGLQFQSSYTWSRVIDTNQSQLNADVASGSSKSPDPTIPNLDKGLAAFDTTQNWRFNTIYRLPEFASAGGAKDKVLNGWWVSGILSLQSGNPFTVPLNSNRSRSGVSGAAAGIDRPDLVPGINPGSITSGTSAGCFGFPAGTPLGTTTNYFDPCAFSIPAAGFLGTAGRNILRGPGFANLDFSVVKDTPLRFLRESGKLEFRAEFFNILNRANFALPARTVFAGTADVQAPLANAGLITSTAGSSRQIQLALKLLF